jgi:predicted dehydrogenase
MVRLALVGLGKMGISHLAIANSHPDVELVAVCDTNSYVATTLNKYTGIPVSTDYRSVLAQGNLDAVIIATPPRFHGEMVRAALERNLHVFCEKPFCMDASEGAELATLATNRKLVNQVGYHCRFVGAFKEAKRLITSGALGRIHHVRAEAYGPVVLRPKGGSWRTQKSEGGGCLQDYACHAIDLMTYIAGTPDRVSGTVLNRIFSHDVEDEAYTTLYFPGGITGQLSSNWSDESYRKMSTKITFWGTNGRLTADRQEVQLFLRDNATGAPALKEGWNTIYTTDLTDEVSYYLRGEEYSAQIDHFIKCIETGQTETISSFTSAVATDQIVSMMLEDSRAVVRTATQRPPSLERALPRRNGIFSRMKALFV